MRDNHFYQRLNQIRNKYGYNHSNQPAKNTTMTYHQPLNATQTYRDIVAQNNRSPQRNTYQNTVSKNNVKVELQKGYNLGISPNRNVNQQRSQQHTTLREDRAPLTKQRQVQQYLNQTQGLDIKPAFKNVSNENYSPSPIKKLRIEGSYQISPTKHDRTFERSQDYQPLKPYNRINFDAVPEFDRNTKQMQVMNSYRKQSKSAWPETPETTKNANRTYKIQSPFEIKPPNSARNGTGYSFEEPKSLQMLGDEEPMGKESVFMQKFDYNVKNIQKIQDKINSILNRQK